MASAENRSCMTDEIKSCHGKVPHGTQQAAQREAERRTEATGEAHEAINAVIVSTGM